MTGKLTVQAETVLGSPTGNVFTTHLLPAANVSYDLGSPTRRWRKLFIAGNTIDLGGATISAQEGGISLTGDSGTVMSISSNGGFAVTTSTGATGNGSFEVVSSNTITANAAVESTNSTTGTIVVTGGIGISGNVNASGNSTIGGTLVAGLISGGTF